MPSKILKRISRSEKGITGLETAIILIAFVVVAAVFAYTALSAGLFATQKSQESVYAGLKEARSTVELKGGVIATANTTGSAGRVKQLTFTLSNVAAGEGIDFTPPTSSANGSGVAATGSTNKVVISYIDKEQQVENLYWSLAKLGSANDNDILEQNEKFQITVGSTDAGGSNAGNLIDALGTDLNINTTFSLVLKTPVGAVLEIERTTPAYMDTIMNLH